MSYLTDERFSTLACVGLLSLYHPSRLSDMPACLFAFSFLRRTFQEIADELRALSTLPTDPTFPQRLRCLDNRLCSAIRSLESLSNRIEALTAEEAQPDEHRGRPPARDASTSPLPVPAPGSVPRRPISTSSQHAPNPAAAPAGPSTGTPGESSDDEDSATGLTADLINSPVFSNFLRVYDLDYLCPHCQINAPGHLPNDCPEV